MTTSVHDDLVAVVRDFTEHELAPHSADLDAGDPGAIGEVWQRLVALGVDRALPDGDRGGAGLDAEDFLSVLEELAVADAGIAAAVLLNNVAVVSLPAETATGLPGGARWAIGLGDRIEVTGDVGSRRATGRLAFVLGGLDADGIVVATRGRHPAVFAVPAAAPGSTVVGDPLQMGLRAARAAELVLDAVAVAPHPDSAVIEPRVRALVRCGIAAIAAGLARRAHDVALRYARARIQGGVRIIEHGAVADMLAAMAVRSRTQCPGGLAAACDDPAAALAYRITATDAAMATAIDAVQVMGGIGYMADTGVEKLMRDAKYCQLYPERGWWALDELVG